MALRMLSPHAPWKGAVLFSAKTVWKQETVNPANDVTAN